MTKTVRNLVLVIRQHQQPFLVREGERSQKNSVDDAVNRRRSADPEGERQDDERRIGR